MYLYKYVYIYIYAWNNSGSLGRAWLNLTKALLASRLWSKTSWQQLHHCSFWASMRLRTRIILGVVSLDGKGSYTGQKQIAFSQQSWIAMCKLALPYTPAYVMCTCSHTLSGRLCCCKRSNQDKCRYSGGHAHLQKPLYAYNTSTDALKVDQSSFLIIINNTI